MQLDVKTVTTKGWQSQPNNNSVSETADLYGPAQSGRSSVLTCI
jgi:hypothetical protein